MANKKLPSRVKGFTLIELMIAVAILAVLSAIAYASYTNYVVSTRRTAASACLAEVSQFAERYYTTNQTYVGVALPALSCSTELAQFYTFAIVDGATATAYSVSATPVGQQLARDNTKCGTLGLNQAGTKTATGSSGAAGCW